MSIAIVCDGKTVLRVQNSIFALFHQTIKLLIQEKQLIVPDISKFLEETDQEVYGSGAVFADLAEYLKTRQEVLLFADLVKEATDLKYENFNRYEGCIEHLRDFHHALMQYAEELEN